MRVGTRLGNCLLGAVIALAAIPSCTKPDPNGFDPVYLEDPATTLQGRIIGRRDGGFYGESAASTPPAYHADRKWLYVIAAPHLSIEILDVGNPAEPRLVDRIGYADFLRALLFGREASREGPVLEAMPPEELEIEAPRLIGEMRSLAFANGVLAVAFSALQENERGRVLFLDEQGSPAADPVSVGIDPDMIAFSPGGSRLVVSNSATGEPGDDPEGSVSIVTLTRRDGRIETDATTIGFERFNGREDELRAQGVRIITPGSSVAQDLEPESVAISKDGGTAYVGFVRNNAFATIDLNAKEVTALRGLGTRDLGIESQGIDASDRDGEIAIRSWPVHAYYEPDGLGLYGIDGQSFLVTANEGDPRDFEDARVADIVLDPLAFENADELRRPENLGRLRITRVEGDVDGDGDFERLFTLGSRSFAIWTTDGDLVFDSGEDFERKTAEAVPAFFNTPDGVNQFDGRSADRGPEPEPLALGEVSGRWYAFVGFERISGVIAYDITAPTAPRFAFYLNNRNFSIDPAEVCEPDSPKTPACAEVGDIEPESLLFIPAERSPIRNPLLVATHEQTDTVTLIELLARGDR